MVLCPKWFGRVILGTTRANGEGTVEKGHPAVHQWNYCVGNSDFKMSVGYKEKNNMETLNFYCAPNHFVFGGTTGLSIVLSTCFPALSVGTFMWIANAVLDVLGCVFLGIKTMGWTLYSSVMLSFYSSVCEKLFPMSRPLTDDTLLELCFAVLLPAIASGIVFNIGASTGGTEILGLILHKYAKLGIGCSMFFCELGIVLFAAWLYGPHTGMYCVLGLLGQSTVLDTAIESLNLRKVCTVITTKPEPIKKFITATLDRTATQQDATGVYTGEPRTLIMVALTRRQAGLLRDFLRREDPEAFLTIVNSSEIIGKGFQSI